MQTLNEIFEVALQLQGPDFFKDKVPSYIYDNLKEGFGKRLYQQEAFGRFVYYWTEYHGRAKGMPTQLLYHMATGSGKTLIMAGLIIYLYNQGYRNFLFFVNSTNIIEKTKDNFFNVGSAKYLFSDRISIGDKRINVREADNFQAAGPDDINIVFSTIQGLHSRLNTPREDSLTSEDFEDRKIVLISDEAHHINAETKKKGIATAQEKEEAESWEGTVNRIFNANSDNVLLEFTATADLSLPEIASKYSSKLIFDYPLKQFRKDGYSKEVKVLQADLPPFERALQGILLSQYRRKVFEKYGKHIKPVILFKSRTIKESQAFFEEFTARVKHLRASDLEKIKASGKDEVIERMFLYFDTHGVSMENLAIELREDFSVEKLISVNSNDESEEKQLAINSLEDETNEYRAVFAVDKLNEGWDVLNLFDIVRLYDTRDSKSGKPGRTTMAEAQLIGRGARYCPFRITDDQPYYVRKYDDDIANELRICEELFYHSAYNPKYIQELNTALVEIGIKAKTSIERELIIKPCFKQSSFYREGFIFLNDQKKYDRRDIFSLKADITQKVHEVTLRTGYSESGGFFEDSSTRGVEKSKEPYALSEFGRPLIRKALDRLEFYKFSNLKRLLPNLNSISEFILSDRYLGSVRLNVSGLPGQADKLSAEDKLDAAVKVLEDIARDLASDNVEYIGTREFRPYMLKDKIKDKVLNFAVNESEDKEYGKSMSNPTETRYYLDLAQKEWYVFQDCYGTSEEKQLVKYIDQVYSRLKDHYDEIYLVRNEKFFRIYNFTDGRPIEPDFVLFLSNNEGSRALHYQIFIEPKGPHLMEKDGWKERFLLSLKSEYNLEQIWKGKEYVIWGMPFPNIQNNTAFEKAFEELL